MGPRLRLALICTGATMLLAAPPAAAFGPLSQFGSTGGGAGQLMGPQRVSVDSDGNAYVADLQNSRISAFGVQGAFLRAFGKDVGGAGQNVCTAFCQPGDGTLGVGVAAQVNAYGVAAAGGHCVRRRHQLQPRLGLRLPGQLLARLRL